MDWNKIQKILKHIELENPHHYPYIEIYSDGSGEILLNTYDGCREAFLNFNTIGELESKVDDYINKYHVSLA